MQHATDIEKLIEEEEARANKIIQPTLSSGVTVHKHKIHSWFGGSVVLATRIHIAQPALPE